MNECKGCGEVRRELQELRRTLAAIGAVALTVSPDVRLEQAERERGDRGAGL